MFNKIAQPVLACCLMLFLAACASSGPIFKDAQAKVAPVAADSGRVFFYRPSSMFGAAVQPSIKLNGEKVGESVPGGYFFVDKPAGSYKISTETEVERDLTLVLEPGQTKYVKTHVSMGFAVGHVSPEIVETDVALKEIVDCHLTTLKK
jgi:hypothetical protein